MVFELKQAHQAAVRPVALEMGLANLIVLQKAVANLIDQTQDGP